jgi:hypothetical protein
MSKILIILGGVLNGLFTVFHIWLGWQIYSLQGLLPEHKALMLMLNVGGILLIGFATFASLFCIKDVLTTRLGKATIFLIILLYASRAVEEIIISPGFSLVIFTTCLAVAAIYALALTGTTHKNRTN